MSKGGKYLAEKAPKTKKGKNKVLLGILIAVLVIILVIVGGAVWYYNYMLGLITRPSDIVKNPNTEATIAQVDSTEEMPEIPTVEESTSPEDTWPVIVPDKNITNIILVGQAGREGEESLIADTMILCSINRETKTLTMTSIMRDLRLVWPEYVDVNGKKHTGNNRVNMAYNMGYRWAGNNSKGGMDMMKNIIEYNFGVPVDYAIEVSFDMVMDLVDMLGGVTVEITQEEYDYLDKNYQWLEEGGVKVGTATIDGYHALCYARMRKVGNGDFERTERQRKMITSIIDSLRDKNILEIHSLFVKILPYVVTDMTNKQITDLAWEMIPMLKNLKIQSQRIPFDGTYNSQQFDIGGQLDYQLVCNTKTNGEMLRKSIGMEEAAAN